MTRRILCPLVVALTLVATLPAATAAAQTRTMPAASFGRADLGRPVATLPATCAIGDIVFLTTGSPGLQQCLTLNTWTAVSGGGGGGTIGGTIAATQVAYGSGANTIAGEAALTWDSTAKALNIGQGFSSGIQGLSIGSVDSGGIINFNINDAESTHNAFPLAANIQLHLNPLDVTVGDSWGLTVQTAFDTLGTGSAGTITGIEIHNVLSNGTVAVSQGLLIDDVTGAAVNYAIKTGLGLVSFGDDIVVATGKALKTDTTTAHSALFQAYDVDDAVHRTFATLTNGNTPTFRIAPPAGGTVTLDATILRVGGHGIELDGAFATSGAFDFLFIFTGPSLVTFPTSGTLATTAQAPLSGTTGSIGGGALAAGQCATGDATVMGATTSMTATASPAADPAPSLSTGVVWDAFVASADTVTVRVCGLVMVTPNATTYNVRVIQ